MPVSPCEERKDAASEERLTQTDGEEMRVRCPWESGPRGILRVLPQGEEKQLPWRPRNKEKRLK